VRTDVRHEEEVKNLVEKTIARFGRMDIAVNNAGTVGNPESAADANIENYKAIFDSNVLGVLLRACVADVAAFLASDTAGSITGASIPVDGGS
jgi:NAD(P)-dependent dehydrogenase (short-subunit alcohol dehydrogenase family)